MSPSIEMWLSSQNAISRPRPRWPASEEASEATPSCEVAVGGDHVRVVIDDLVALAVEALGEHALGERHADGGRDALAERPGRGLDPGRVAVLGVPGGRRAELAEVLEVVERQPVARSGTASSTGASTRARS